MLGCWNALALKLREEQAVCALCTPPHVEKRMGSKSGLCGSDF